MNKRNFLIIMLSTVLLSSCDIAQQLASTYNMVNCKYDYNSVSNVVVSGMDLSKGVQLAYIPKITTLLMGKQSSVPIDLIVNLDVSNPNTSEALMNGMQYILSIDGIQFTTGSLNNKLNIAPGGKQVLPLNIGFDLATLLKGDSADAVSGIVKNFLGIGSKKSEVSLQIKPSFMVGSRAVASPVYIPVKFSFGGN